MTRRLAIIDFINNLISEVDLKGEILKRDYIIHDLDGFDQHRAQMVDALERTKSTWLVLEDGGKINIEELSQMCFILDRVDQLSLGCEYPSSDALILLMLGTLFLFDSDKAPTREQLAFFKKALRDSARQHEFFEKSLFDAKVCKPTTKIGLFELDRIEARFPSFKPTPVICNQDFFSTIPASVDLMTSDLLDFSGRVNFKFDFKKKITKFDHNQQLEIVEIVGLEWPDSQAVKQLKENFRLNVKSITCSDNPSVANNPFDSLESFDLRGWLLLGRDPWVINLKHLKVDGIVDIGEKNHLS